jgi:hypothetical protein
MSIAYQGFADSPLATFVRPAGRKKRGWRLACQGFADSPLAKFVRPAGRKKRGWWLAYQGFADSPLAKFVRPPGAEPERPARSMDTWTHRRQSRHARIARAWGVKGERRRWDGRAPGLPGEPVREGGVMSTRATYGLPGWPSPRPSPCDGEGAVWLSSWPLITTVGDRTTVKKSDFPLNRHLVQSIIYEGSSSGVRSGYGGVGHDHTRRYHIRLIYLLARLLEPFEPARSPARANTLRKSLQTTEVPRTTRRVGEGACAAVLRLALRVAQGVSRGPKRCRSVASAERRRETCCGDAVF